MLTKKLTYLVFTFLVCCVSIAAQDSLLLRDYSFIKQSSSWLTQRNAAALTLCDNKNIAEAELLLSHGSGKLTGISGSPSLTTLQAFIESYYRINPRTVVFGAISYDNQSGSDMTGSVFMQQRLPFDIVEDSLTNAGRKHRDTYHLIGGCGYDIYKGISIGLKADYTAANYAKYQDLRHKNKLMDLKLTVGVFAPFTSWLNVGADYTYLRRTESVKFDTYGKNEKVYKSLIDYGGMMGIVEQFGNDGYTDKTNEMPLFEDGHSVGLQLGFFPQRSLQRQTLKERMFNVQCSMEFSHTTGYYGSKSPYTITYTDHDRDILANHIRLSYLPSTGTSRHHLDLHYQNEKLQNNMNTFRGQTNTTGATHYEYYDATEAGNKSWRNLDIDYTMYLGIRHEMPTWTMTAGYHWQQRDMSSYLYPYYRQQQLRTNALTATVTRNFMMPKGVWGITVNGGYKKGSGEPYTDGTFVTPGSKQYQPATQEALLWHDYQYLTAAQYNIGLQMKYTFIFLGTNLRTHIRAAIDYRRASITDETPSGLHNPHRTYLTIAAGHTF